MNSRTLTLLKAVMWSVCAFHLIVGVGLNLLPSTATLMADIYGADVNWNPELAYILKPLGAFMLVLGIMAAGAAIDPLRYRLVVYSFAVLFVLRAVQRVVFAQELQDTFGIAWSRNLGNIVFFLGLAATLIVLDVLVRRGDASSQPSSPSVVSPAS